MEQKRIVRIVVASPGDVQAERDALPTIIDEINRSIAIERGLSLEFSRWETDGYPGFHQDGPQGLIDPILKIEDCDVLIGIFWKRFGTPTKDARSGTEHEILSAYEARKKKGKPQIMVYFNQKAYAPKSIEELDQWRQVFEFKQRFPQEGLWWPYKGKAQFEKLVRNQLTRFILDHFPSQDKTGAADDGAWNPQDISHGRGTADLIKAYRDDLFERMSKIYLFGESEPRVLDKVFVEVTVTEDYQRPTVHAEFMGMMDSEMRRRRNPFTHDYEFEEDLTEGKNNRALKPDELLKRRALAVITGAPGCGKTTLLRYLASKTHEANERLPVFLELKTVTDDSFKQARSNLAELLFDKAVATAPQLQIAERARLRDFFFARLAAGEAAIFLDGLDEVSGANFFHRLCDSVNEFVRSIHPANTLIISTRPYALQSRFEKLKEMEIAPLNQQQIEEFFLHYYGDALATRQLLQTLRQYRPIRELMRVPFLLSVITQLYHQRNKLVENRLELYRQIVWQLVTQLDREKSVVRHHFRIPDRTGSLKLDFLKQLACERLLLDDLMDEGVEHQVGRLVFTGDLILNQAKQFWERTKPPTEGSPYDLADDVKATPLLREVGADVYAFTHLTIQEYLAADALSRRDDCEKILCRAYFNPTLAEMEVLPMTLGLARNPAPLCTALEQLPESLNYASFRLRARSLAYFSTLDSRLLTGLATRLVDFIKSRRIAEIPYQRVVVRSFSTANSSILNFIADRVAPLLCQPDYDARDAAVNTLKTLGGERAIEALLTALDNDNPRMIEKAAQALGQVGDKRAIPLLVELLNDEDFGVRRGAINAIAKLGGKDVVDILVWALGDEHEDVRTNAAYSLGEIGGEQVLDALLVALKSVDADVRGGAAKALGVIGGQKAVTALIKALKDRDSEVRGDAAYSLGTLKAEDAIDALAEMLLKDADHIVRAGAVMAIQDIGGDKVVNVLIKALKDEYSVVQYVAAEVLGEIGAERAVGALAVALKERDYLVNLHAADALKAIGTKEALAALTEALSDENSGTRVSAAAAVAEAGGELAVDILIDGLKDEDGGVRWNAMDALENIRGEKVTKALLAALKDTSSSVRAMAASALGKIGDKRAVDILIGMLKDKDIGVRRTAAEVLGQMGEARGAVALLQVLKDKEVFVRETAAEALGQIDNKALAEGLTLALSNRDGYVRKKAAQSVGYYANGKQVLDKLARMALEDSVKAVRIVAGESRDKFARKLEYYC